MYASHFNWLQVSFRRTSLSSTGFESRKGERFPRAQGRRYLPVSASILLYFESLILNPTLRGEHQRPRRMKSKISRPSCSSAVLKAKHSGKLIVHLQSAERRQVNIVCGKLLHMDEHLLPSGVPRAAILPMSLLCGSTQRSNSQLSRALRA